MDMCVCVMDASTGCSQVFLSAVFAKQGILSLEVIVAVSMTMLQLCSYLTELDLGDSLLLFRGKKSGK